MNGTREEYLEWDKLMSDVGVPEERYSQMRADRIARLIINSCPAHLLLTEWTLLITKAIAALFPPDDPDDEFANIEAVIEIGDSDNP